mmetsp:Transcript_143522/g.458973  ORF Transcript_143522/g.458973 Transcript_143522/m.458973 type:complete len:218 (+) Transcript_143522:592-1245(+)
MRLHSRAELVVPRLHLINRHLRDVYIHNLSVAVVIKLFRKPRCSAAQHQDAAGFFRTRSRYQGLQLRILSDPLVMPLLAEAPIPICTFPIRRQVFDRGNCTRVSSEHHKQLLDDRRPHLRLLGNKPLTLVKASGPSQHARQLGFQVAFCCRKLIAQARPVVGLRSQISRQIAQRYVLHIVCQVRHRQEISVRWIQSDEQIRATNLQDATHCGQHLHD